MLYKTRKLSIHPMLYQVKDTAKMTLRIETYSDGRNTTIQLVGRICREHLEELKAQMKDSLLRVTLDLSEVGLVDIDAVCFLATCQRQGIELLHCAPYISSWVEKEQDKEN
jgi:ABC-type transporter Mla MlaB component